MVLLLAGAIVVGVGLLPARLLASPVPTAKGVDRPATVSAAARPGLQPTGRRLRGVASWYGPGFNGRRTASGEIYDERRFTAASPTLRFGTVLRVRANGRSVFVRINDRGPYVGGRVLDLSRAAARALGHGVGPVVAEIYR